MNTDKAYLFGLIIGGGVFGGNEAQFKIRLPYKQWGSFMRNPVRVGEISRDIMNVVSPPFRSIYGINVSFEATNSEWNILCEGDLAQLKADLLSYGIECEGDMRLRFGFAGIIPALVDLNLKRRFIAGLADTIASTVESHRRFTNEIQTVSFEIKGFNFPAVCNLCKLLYSVNCFPDQVAWNHPNCHATCDFYYRGWAKGFKIRIMLDQYITSGSFAFRSKAESAQENRGLQQQTHRATPCPERDISVSRSCVHPGENDTRLPESIRGGHYIHNRHFCAVLGCEHAPYEKIAEKFSQVGNLIIPFPILYKDVIGRIESTIGTDGLLANREYATLHVSVGVLHSQYVENKRQLIYGTNAGNGYPISEVMQAIAFVIADNNELKGKRPIGSFEQLIERHIEEDPELSVEIRTPDLLTPLVVAANGRGALIGARNPLVYEGLVSRDPDNPYKLCVRSIAEDDLR